jgi:hypothetical protein
MSEKRRLYYYIGLNQFAGNGCQYPAFSGLVVMSFGGVLSRLGV